MKYVAIIVFAFVIQVANAAPQYDDNLFLDELLEMNVRMGNIILMAKYQRDSNNNEWKHDTPIEENSQDSTIIGNKDPVSQSDGGDDGVDKNDSSNTEEPHTEKEPQNSEEETEETTTTTTTTTTTESVIVADNVQQTDAPHEYVPYWGDEKPTNKKDNGWFGNFFS